MENTLNKVKKFSTDYTQALNKINNEIIAKCIDLIYDAKDQEKSIFIFGNGGSHTIATHLGCDLGKGTKSVNQRKFFKVFSLDNAAWFSAQANDGDEYFHQKQGIPVMVFAFHQQLVQAFAK